MPQIQPVCLPPRPRVRPANLARLALAVAGALVLTLCVLRPAQAREREIPPVPSQIATRLILASLPVTVTESISDTPLGIALDDSATPSPTLHVVHQGDTLFLVARAYSVTLESLIASNAITDPNRIEVGQVLIVPAPTTTTGAGPIPPSSSPFITPTTDAASVGAPEDILGRLNQAGRDASLTSPYYRTTWLTYYGRPKIFVMGILGEHDIETLTGLLKEKAAELDAANGSLKVKPAFHLVHGMATTQPTAERDHLEYLPDDVVMQYIDAGLKENFGVILDVQIGALSVTDALSPTLKYLKYPNVHLAIDPEFAMSHPGQEVPGNPIGYVTGEEVNAAQNLIADYMEKNGIRGRRILLVHEFFEEMIVDKDVIDMDNPRVELTFCADGYGDAGAKIWKYNHFFTGRDDVKYAAFKLFYRWDKPVLSDAEALGTDPWSSKTRMEVTPNMLIYQ